MELVQYNNIDDKKKFFYGINSPYKIVTNTHEFDELNEEFKELERCFKERWVFRGVNEAKFKLYTSFQRMWANRGLDCLGINHTDSIANLIEIARNGSELAKYYKAIGIDLNDWMILSFLQHYGSATPLLDFSKSYKTSLFFAFDNVKINNGGRHINDTIDNYVSVYYYQTVDVANGIAPSVYKTAKNNALEYNFESIDEFWKMIGFHHLVIPDPQKLRIIPTYDEAKPIKIKLTSGIEHTVKYSVTNMNSNAQSGVFLCNSNEVEPIENLLQGKLHCVDIHKSLFEYCQKNILAVPIAEAKKIYYPSNIDIALGIQQQLFERIN